MAPSSTPLQAADPAALASDVADLVEQCTNDAVPVLSELHTQMQELDSRRDDLFTQAFMLDLDQNLENFEILLESVATALGPIQETLSTLRNRMEVVLQGFEEDEEGLEEGDEEEDEGDDSV